MDKTKNIIQTIVPYCCGGIWQFDDPSTGLVGEAFVAGADDMMELLSAPIEYGRNGFNLLFSHIEFPGHTLALRKSKKKDVVGTTYIHEESGRMAWLCPALLLYFTKPPDHLYAQAKPLDKPIKRARPAPKWQYGGPGYGNFGTLSRYME